MYRLKKNWDWLYESRKKIVSCKTVEILAKGHHCAICRAENGAEWADYSQRGRSVASLLPTIPLTLTKPYSAWLQT